MFYRFFLMVLCLFSLAAHAAEPVTLSICYRYGCKNTGTAELSVEAQQWIAQRLAKADSPETERAALSDVVLAMFRIAAQTTPIWQDKGGNFADGAAEGRMDCVDHSTNVTTFLDYLQSQGWLKFHSTAKPDWRAPWLFDLHYTAVLQETQSSQKWAVDSWFKDFGHPPEIIPLEVWAKGYTP